MKCLFVFLILLYPMIVGANTNFHQCLSDIERRTGLDKDLLIAIKYAESGRSLAPPVNNNTNGSRDIGIMQINTVWLPVLAKHGIDSR